MAFRSQDLGPRWAHRCWAISADGTRKYVCVLMHTYLPIHIFLCIYLYLKLIILYQYFQLLTITMELTLDFLTSVLITPHPALRNLALTFLSINFSNFLCVISLPSNCLLHSAHSSWPHWSPSLPSHVHQPCGIISLTTPSMPATSWPSWNQLLIARPFWSQGYFQSDPCPHFICCCCC